MTQTCGGGTKVFGKMIFSPDKLKEVPCHNIVVFVACVDFVAVRNQLIALGIKNIFFAHMFDVSLLNQATNQIALPSVSEKVINDVLNLFADEKSRDIFVQILKKREVDDRNYLDISEDCAQYFIPELLETLSGDEIYVDGGPYDGREIDTFINHCPGTSKIYAFEPDMNNFLKLKKKYMNISKVCLNDLALWSENKGLCFLNETLGSISRLCLVEAARTESRTKVNAIALDQFLSQNDLKVGKLFIKMDIEGAEMEALYGSKKIIKEYRPKLAICVYHRPNDIVDIPIFLKKLVPDYTFLLRHHSAVNNETVLYAF